jgi:Ras-related protein Rab-1A
MRYADNSFAETFFNTIGVDFVISMQKVKTIQLQGKVVKLQIWDTAGQERFRTITSTYYRGAHGIVVVYDVTDRESFESVRMWMGEIGRYASSGVNCMIIGNKNDLAERRTVTFEEGNELATKLKVPFMETSAKDSSNVDYVFELITEVVYQRLSQQPQDVGAAANLARKPTACKESCCGA